jgi:hypothetical protein
VHSSSFIKMSGPGTRVVLARQHGLSMPLGLTYMHSKSLGQHGCWESKVAVTLKRNVVFGPADIKSWPPRPWRTFSLVYCRHHVDMVFYPFSTCFWAGDTFAPKLKIVMPDGQTKPVQQYLQDAFLDMYATVVQALDGLDGVIGFEASLCNA